jgi:hypothetical protein
MPSEPEGRLCIERNAIELEQNMPEASDDLIFDRSAAPGGATNGIDPRPRTGRR